MSILVITTGGTMGALAYPDPQNPPVNSTMPLGRQDLIRKALQTRFRSIPTRCISLQPRDSKKIDFTYRRNMLVLTSNAPEKRTLITHGTDTILETAGYFYDKFRTSRVLDGKLMILTGAMTPLANGEKSDGHQNFEFALNMLKNPPRGISPVSVVLSDFDKNGEWKPQLYPYRPGVYKKHYDTDGRYNRLVKA